MVSLLEATPIDDVDKDPPASPLASPRLDLTAAQRTALNDEMEHKSQSKLWRLRIDNAGDDESKWPDLLQDVIVTLTGALASTDLKDIVIAAVTMPEAFKLVQDFNESELKEWKDGVWKGVKDNEWVDSGLITHPLAKLRAKISPSSSSESQAGGWQLRSSRQLDQFNRLSNAYNTPFLGDAATNLVKLLCKREEEVQADVTLCYAKAIPVVQSSGTGKSRMLTEVGKLIFTLPICLREPSAPGYPPSDVAAYNYFHALDKHNDLSLSAHASTACFLAASHKTMLAWLKKKHMEGLGGPELLIHWHGLMEYQDKRHDREKFFSEVVMFAISLKEQVACHLEQSPRQTKDGKTTFNIEAFAHQTYQNHAKKATEDLVTFLATLSPRESVLCVTYVDESDALGGLFWVLLRLLSNQDQLTAMWYIFMATKSSITYFNPISKNMRSIRLKDEAKRLFPPYLALGFDQNMVVNGQAETHITVGKLQTLEHICKYGRPLWHALLPEEGAGVIDTAALKLRGGGAFDKNDTHHVLAVLSQRLCIDPVLAGSEAIALADRSVAHHMRLLTGVSSDSRVFYTCSPSEPALVLGAADILYKKAQLWSPVLDTFSRGLCESGLIEKGLVGELGARTLLLVARDFTAPMKAPNKGPDLLKPVLLMEFLDQLFGNQAWCGQDRAHFESAFDQTYVNFTHWVVTKDPLPEVPDQQLLANLYARGAALQCSFNQESMDLLIPDYMGSITADAPFDPAGLSAIIVQIKYKIAGDENAGHALRPIGIHRDICQPLPYLALLLELGSNSNYKGSRSRIKTTASAPARHGEFRRLTDDWLGTVDAIDAYRDQRKVKGEKVKKKQVKKLKRAMEQARLKMDSCNRYSIFVHGASPHTYGILGKAKIAAAFKLLLQVTMPQPIIQDPVIQHMQPFEHLRTTSAHMAWMSKYAMEELGDDEDMDGSENEAEELGNDEDMEGSEDDAEKLGNDEDMEGSEDDADDDKDMECSD